MGFIKWLRSIFDQAEKQEEIIMEDKYKFENELYTLAEWNAKVKKETPLSLAGLHNAIYEVKNGSNVVINDKFNNKIGEEEVFIEKGTRLRLLQCGEHPGDTNAFRWLNRYTVNIHFKDLIFISGHRNGVR